jgi:hypothetical protein
MTKPAQTASKPPTADDLIQEEALRVARRVQKPGQTKEQTKLITQGIAKGIEEYKRQQSEKSRERDKARKRALKQKPPSAPEHDSPVLDAAEWAGAAESRLVAPALWAGGALFAALAVAHLLRVVFGLGLAVGPWAVPAWISLVAAAALAGLSLWFFSLAVANR